MTDLFEIQPEGCREPLPFKEVEAADYMKRVMFDDPTQLYERLRHKINPYERYNYLNFSEMFPPREDGTCACGCGIKLENGQTTYANKECQMYAVCVWEIIGGRAAFIDHLFETYQGNKLCQSCGKFKWVDIDHIFPVSKGGGGSWLSNFQGLCKKCHKEKTRKDFNWTKLKTSE